MKYFQKGDTVGFVYEGLWKVGKIVSVSGSSLLVGFDDEGRTRKAYLYKKSLTRENGVWLQNVTRC